MISVVICTRNRARDLETALDSIVSASRSIAFAWELVVVDNGSADRTREAILGYADRLPIRYAHEPRPGLSNARNLGVAQARGDYFIWTDDDVRVSETWLSAYAAAFAAAPEAALFGGEIRPVLSAPTPRWFAENLPSLGGLLARRDIATMRAPMSLAGDALPYGANFAVRGLEQRRCRFDPNLGVSPTQRRLGEETAVMRRILVEGGSGAWVPGAYVEHLIPVSRQSTAYVRQYQRASGETWAYLDRRGESFFGGPPSVRGVSCSEHRPGSGEELSRTILSTWSAE